MTADTDLYIERPRPRRGRRRAEPGPRLLILTLMIAVLAASAAGFFTYRNRMNTAVQTTYGGLKMFSVMFNNDNISALTGTPADAGATLYEETKAALDRIRVSSPNVVVAELLRYDPATGTLTRLARSPENPGHDPAPLSPEAAGELVNKTGFTVKLSRSPDAGGDYTFYGYAMANHGGFSPRNENAFEVVHYQIDAIPALRGAIAGACERAVGVLMLFSLPLAVYFVARGGIRQQRTLRELTMAIDQCETAFSIGTPDEHSIYANEGLCRQYGYSREELSRMKWWDLLAEKPADVVRPWRALFGPGAKPRKYYLTMRRKNGEHFPARVDLTPLRIKHDGGEIFCSINILTDLTEIKKPVRLLDEARRRVEEASRAKSAFIAMISHEVRTPLNGIVGFASLLLDTRPPPEQSACVRSIRQYGEKLVRVATDILEVSRLEAGVLKTEICESDPDMLMLEVIGAANGGNADNRISFQTSIDPALPGALLLDFVHLRHVLIHLAQSAARHVQDGVVEIAFKKIPGDFAPAAPDAAAPDGALTLQISVIGTKNGAQNDAPETPPKRPAAGRDHENVPLSLLIARRLVHMMDCPVYCDTCDARRFAYIFSTQCRSRA